MSKARGSQRVTSGSGVVPVPGGVSVHERTNESATSVAPQAPPLDRKSAISGTGTQPPAPTSGGESLTQIQLASRLALSEKQIRNLTRDNVISRNPDRSYPWPQVQKEYIKWKQEEKDRRTSSDDPDELNLVDEQAKLTAIRREMAELDLAERLGELVDVGDVDQMLRTPLEQVDSALKNAPARYAHDLAQQAGIKTPIAMKLIEQIVERIRADIRKSRHVDDATAAA